MKCLPGPHHMIFVRNNDVKDFLRVEVERHQKDLDRDNPRDYIDSFLIEAEKVRGTHWVAKGFLLFFPPAGRFWLTFYTSQYEDKETIGFTVHNIVLCMLDLFLAGTQTTSLTLQWGMIFLCKYPEVQGKHSVTIDNVPKRTESISDNVRN